MTLLELPIGNLRENCTPVLETKRLVLRAPRYEDIKQVAMLANDRRVAENTLFIPHPYAAADAKGWIAAAAATGTSKVRVSSNRRRSRPR